MFLFPELDEAFRKGEGTREEGEGKWGMIKAPAGFFSVPANRRALFPSFPFLPLSLTRPPPPFFTRHRPRKERTGSVAVVGESIRVGQGRQASASHKETREGPREEENIVSFLFSSLGVGGALSLTFSLSIPIPTRGMEVVVVSGGIRWK